MRTHLPIPLRRALVGLLLLAAACGGTDGGGSTSGLSPSKRLVDLSATENGQLCDWMVPKVGSYGNPGTCDRTQTGTMAVALIYNDQAACIADAPDLTDTDCVGTVAQMEACVNQLPACATLTDVLNAPACAAVLTC